MLHPLDGVAFRDVEQAREITPAARDGASRSAAREEPLLVLREFAE